MAQNHACKPTHNDENNAAFYYSVNMLRLLLGMKLISQEEYAHIVDATAAYYRTNLICPN